MRSDVPEKLLRIASEIRALGSAHTTRLTIIKRWFPDHKRRLPVLAILVASRVARRESMVTREAADLFRRARALLGGHPPAVPRRAAQRLHEDLREFMYIDMYTLGVAIRYSIAEARSHLPSIVDQVEAGAAVELTRRGTPVAVVVSLHQFARLRSDRPRFDEAYRAFLKKFDLRDVGLDPDLIRSLRDSARGRAVAL